MKTFVDTCVFVAWLDARHAAKQMAADQWIRRLWLQQSGRTSMQVLDELYVTLTRKLRTRNTEDDAWDVVSALLAWEPIASDRDVMKQTREVQKRYGISWWDSHIVAAAQMQDCAVLLSEDLQHGASFGAVTVRNPFSAAVQEPQPRYEPQPLAPRHRPRGRPRKTAPA